jgi:hypothetical protein
MKIVKDTLSVLVEEWSDPGVYPSNAGGYALPSYKYLAGMEGELVLELTAEDVVMFRETVRDECLNEWVYSCVEYKKNHPEVSSMTWEVESEVEENGGLIVTLIVPEVEANPDYGMDDEPDEYDY